MSARRKTRAVYAFLLAVALWPAVQMVLVARYDVSPWKLAGFGMYTVPRFGLVGMEIHGRPSAASDWIQLTTPSPELRAIASEFLERHRWLRGLASARDLLARVRTENPDWQEVRLAVAYPKLDLATSRVVLTRDERHE